MSISKTNQSWSGGMEKLTSAQANKLPEQGEFSGTLKPDFQKKVRRSKIFGPHPECDEAELKAFAAKESDPELPKLTLNRLARALFDTDPEVKTYVYKRGDFSFDIQTSIGTLCEIDVERLTAAMNTCWRIDDQGFKTRAFARAKAVIEALR